MRDLVNRQVWTFDPDQNVSEAIASMRAQDFDLAAVGPEPVASFVRRIDLEGLSGTVGEFAQPIPIEWCVDRSLPISELFAHLERRDYVFVLNGDHVRWIVTRAELNAPAVGVVMLSYLTIIEGGLRQLARRLNENQLLSLFNTEQRTRIQDLHTRKRRNGIAIGVHDCLTLGNWFHVVRRYPPIFDALGFVDHLQHRRETEGFEDLRNAVAHGGRLLDELSPTAALEAFRRARSYAARVWDAIDRAQPIWDVYLKTEIFRRKNGRETPLTGTDSPEDIGGGSMHVITAWNPGSIGADKIQNEVANRELRKTLEADGVEQIQNAVGRDPDGSQFENSFLVRGLTRRRAAAIGGLFDQAAIFELDELTLRVIRCPDALVMAERARRM